TACCEPFWPPFPPFPARRTGGHPALNVHADSEGMNNMQVHEENAPHAAAPAPPERTLVLVGLMGARESTVGRRLASALRLPFHDADQEIEAAAGCSISDFFERYGEKAFREGERKVIARLLNGPRHVLATGGGAFMDAETRKVIKERGLS